MIYNTTTNKLKYKGYTGNIDYIDGLWQGMVQGIQVEIKYSHENKYKLGREFKKAVDGYIKDMQDVDETVNELDTHEFNESMEYLKQSEKNDYKKVTK